MFIKFFQLNSVIMNVDYFFIPSHQRIKGFIYDFIQSKNFISKYNYITHNFIISIWITNIFKKC